MSEAQARERFRAQDYVLVKHKISSGHCHEFYAVDAQGTVVESYLHPITGEVVRTTRVPAPPPRYPWPAHRAESPEVSGRLASRGARLRAPRPALPPGLWAGAPPPGSG